ncbi:MAG: cache domain-containing protein [Nanoarchaeota archaeon]|nr:cache domain-containing protein [Nanoarchaeota archaeon]
MKISTLLAVVFFVIALLSSTGGTAYYYKQSTSIVKQQIFENLETLSQLKLQSIDYFFDGQQDKIRIISISRGLDNSDLLNLVNINRQFYELFILDPGGIIIASSNELRVGLDMSKKDYFVNAKNTIYVTDAYYSKTTGKNNILFSLINNDNNILVARIELNALDEIMLDRAGLGDSEEFYLINSEKYILTPQLFEDNAPLGVVIDTLGARRCFGNSLGENNGMLTYRDYRGERVIGVSYYIEERDWCLLVKIDETEVLGSREKAFQKTSLSIIAIFITSVTLFGYIIGLFLDKLIVLRKNKRKF